MSNFFNRPGNDRQPVSPVQSQQPPRQADVVRPAEQPRTAEHSLHSHQSTAQEAVKPAAPAVEKASEKKAQDALLGTTKTPPKRVQDPNFLTVDGFCNKLKEKGHVLGHDYVVKCIKAGVIKNAPQPSLLPNEAKKSIVYRIPVGEVSRIAAQLDELAKGE